MIDFAIGLYVGALLMFIIIALFYPDKDEPEDAEHICTVDWRIRDKKCFNKCCNECKDKYNCTSPLQCVVIPKHCGFSIKK